MSKRFETSTYTHTHTHMRVELLSGDMTLHYDLDKGGKSDTKCNKAAAELSYYYYKILFSHNKL